MNRPHRPIPESAVETISQFLRAHALGTGSDGVVVGLSGGVDSALVARLARDALGAARVLGLLLPDTTMPPALVAETEEYGRSLGIETRTIPIDPMEDAFRGALPEVRDRVALGNTTARIRMTVLYAVARERRRLVVGTGNKSELLLGYFTKYGDGGADLLPIGDLYKGEVWGLAAELGIPPSIRERAPTAGFWEGQTDEGELGATYAEIDSVLRGLEELRREPEIVAETGLPPELVRGILGRVEMYRHKRRLPPVAKLGLRTVGIDWRD